MSKQAKRKPLLSDHKRTGKKLVPPLKQIGTLYLTSWVDVGLPECIWHAALQDVLGRKDGVQLGLDLCKLAGGVANQGIFRIVSDFARLLPEEITAIREGLGESKRTDLVAGLGAFCRLYPECPIRPLVGISAEEPFTSEDVTWCRSLVSRLFDKTGLAATHALAALVYVTFAEGALFVSPSSVLSKFPDIEEYPETEDSRRIASAVRATVNSFFGPSERDAVWPKYFWFRSFLFEPCSFEESPNGE